MNNENLQENSSYKSSSPSVYKVRVHDNLDISLNSLSENTTSFFGQNAVPLQSVTPAQLYIEGYMVDVNGNINLPQIGNLKVAGLSITEIKKTVEEKLKHYLKFVSVTVKLVNFRITILGEVKNPGVQYVYENKITIFQAVSNASDLTSFGNRKKIRLIREDDNGNRNTVSLDLSNPNIVASEYYLLQPNDVIYVEPLKAKAFSVNGTSISIAFSTISILLTVINFLR